MLLRLLYYRYPTYLLVGSREATYFTYLFRASCRKLNSLKKGLHNKGLHNKGDKMIMIEGGKIELTEERFMSSKHYLPQ